MDRSKNFAYSVLCALGAAAYVALVACLMTSGERIFGQSGSALIPFAILMLFSLSAAIMGLLIFGRSIWMYLQGEKRVAVEAVLYTVGSFLALTVLAFLIALFINA